MRTTIGILFGLILGAVLGLLVRAPEPVFAAPKAAETALPPLGVTVPGQVIQTHDGDTLTCRVTVDAVIRLRDCWARELREPGGPEARDALTALANGKPCRLSIPFEGARTIADVLTFGRVLGRINVDGVDVSEWMVANGFAGRTKEDEAKLRFPKAKQ